MAEAFTKRALELVAKLAADHFDKEKLEPSDVAEKRAEAEHFLVQQEPEKALRSAFEAIDLILRFIDISEKGRRETWELLEVTQAAEEHAKENLDTVLESSALTATAALNLAKLRLPEAKKAAEQAIERSRKNKDRMGEAAAMRIIRDMHYESALCTFGKLTEYQISLLQEEKLASMRSKMAEHLEEAVEKGELAVAIYRESRDKKREAQAHFDLWGIYMRKGEGEDARSVAKSAATLFGEAGNKEMEFRGLQAAIDASVSYGDGAEAVQTAEDLVSLYRGHGADKQLLGKALHSLAKVLFEMGELEKVEKTVADAYQVFGDLRAHAQQAEVKYTLMNAYVAQEKFDQAIATASEVLELFRDARDRKGEASAINTLATVKLSRFFNDYDKKMTDIKKWEATAGYDGERHEISLDEQKEGYELIDQAFRIFEAEDDMAGMDLCRETMNSVMEQAKEQHKKFCDPVKTYVTKKGRYDVYDFGDGPEEPDAKTIQKNLRKTESIYSKPAVDPQAQPYVNLLWTHNDDGTLKDQN